MSLSKKQLVTLAFSINEVQVLFTFTLVRAPSVDALVEIIRATVQVIIQTFIDILVKKIVMKLLAIQIKDPFMCDRN